MSRATSTRSPLPLTLALAALAAGGCGLPDIEFDAPGVRTTPVLDTYGSCREMEADLKAHLRSEMRAEVARNERWMLDGGFFGGPVAVGGDDVALESDAAGANTSTRQEGVDYTGTNNQEAGVDEGDFIKTDGHFLYVLNGRRLEILGVPTFGQLTHVSTTPLEGQPRQLLLDGDRAVVLSDIYTWDLPGDHALAPHLAAASGGEEAAYMWRGTTLVKATVLDLSADRTEVTTVRSIYVEGWMLAAREIDGVVRLVTHASFEVPHLRYSPEVADVFWALPPFSPTRASMLRDATERTMVHNDAVISSARLESFVPAMYELIDGDVVELPFARGGCGNFYIAEDATGHGFTSILSLDLGDDEGPVDLEADHVVSDWSTVYASEDALLLAEPAQSGWWYWANPDFDEATNIHRFDLVGAGARYAGSGRVPGTIIGSFALSERGGDIRVATTENTWAWRDEMPEPTSGVYVLRGEGALGLVGKVEGLAPGETIWSVRFVEDQAFVVTFRQVDPLFTIDLSEPTRPRVMGELKIPGVSTYIHPVDDDTLLTVGYAGEEDGLAWGTTRVSLFDVGDFSNPALTDHADLHPVTSGNAADWGYSYSEALYEHKAFQYWGPQKMLAVPLSTYRYANNGYEYITRLELLNVAPGEGLSRHGSIDHSAFFNDGDTWWNNRDVRRAVFMGDFVYAISDRCVSAHRLEDLALSARVELPGAVDDVAYYDWVD